MSSGVIYNPPERIVPSFNPDDWMAGHDISLTVSEGDSRYLKLIGGTEKGSVLFVDGLNTSSNVGINTSTTSHMLEVNGDVAISSNVYVDTNALYVDTVNNRCGIGKTPAYTLDVAGDMNLSTGSSFKINNVTVLDYTTLYVNVTNNLTQIRGTHSSSTGNSLGATNIINGTDNGANTAVGTYQRWWGWDTANTSHTILEQYFACNTGNDNYGCNMTIFCSNKLASGAKNGMINCDIIKSYGSNTSVTTLVTSKTSNLTTFSVANTGDDLIVTTDSDCLISWIVRGAV